MTTTRLTCADLAAAGRWDLANCCSRCHSRASADDDDVDYDDYDTTHCLVTVEDSEGRRWAVCSSASAVVPRKPVDWELMSVRLSGLALDAGVPAESIALANALGKALDDHLRGGKPPATN